MLHGWVARLLLGLVSLTLCAGCPAERAPAQPSYTIHLVEVGPRQGEVIACVASLRGCSPEIAQGLVAKKSRASEQGSNSIPVRTGLTREAAEQGVQALERAGARARVVQVP